MQPFFLLKGGKHNLARRLGPPRRDHVVEAFAGSAGFSCYWQPQKVTLIELDPTVYGVWHYLQRATAKEIMRLPANVASVEELPPRVCPEARALVGFWLNHALQRPGVSRSNWARQPRYAANFWSETIKLRLAGQVEKIRHWKIVHGSYEDAPNIEAHWHVDPPYQNLGWDYPYAEVDYPQLAKWCLRRKGYTQVCEAQDADWLPFEAYAAIANRFRTQVAVEVVFERETDSRCFAA